MAKIMDKPEYYKVVANYVVLTTYEPGKCPIMDAEKILLTWWGNTFTRERGFLVWYTTNRRHPKQGNRNGTEFIGTEGAKCNLYRPHGQETRADGQDRWLWVVYMFNPDCEHYGRNARCISFLENKDKGIDVYAIAIDTDDAKWKAYIKRMVCWTNVHDPTNRSIYAKYYVDVTPEIYVLNKERKNHRKEPKTDQIQIIIDRDKKTRANHRYRDEVWPLIWEHK